MERVRCFVAVELSDAVRKSLPHEALAALDADVKWVRPENLHLTLRFLGELPQEQVEAIRSGLKEIQVPPFTLRLAGLGRFPEKGRRIRVVWVGVSGDLGALKTLWEGAQRCARAAGLPRDDHGFSPHITLGRVRSGRGGPVLLEALERQADREYGEQRVDRFVLMQSRLELGGAIYTPVEQFTL